MPDIPRAHPRIRRLALPIAGILALAAAGGVLLSVWDREPTTFVRRSDLQIAAVRREPFTEYLTLTARARSARLLRVETEEAGRVAEVRVRPGDRVTAGSELLRLANDGLDADAALLEVRRREREHDRAAQRHGAAQAGAEWDQRVLDQRSAVSSLERELAARESLLREGHIARSALEATSSSLALERARLDSIAAARGADLAAREERLLQASATLEGIALEAAVLARRRERLVVRAPVAGRIVAFDPVPGQSLPAGSVVAQIELDGTFVLACAVPEQHLPRLAPGMRAAGSFGGATVSLAVSRVSPEVRDGAAEAELSFDGPPPPSLVAGSTVVVRIDLGAAGDAIVLRRGQYAELTGGSWVFVVEGEAARRRAIVPGRRNPEDMEVLEGLAPGEQVIISSYELFGDSERLTLTN